MSRFYDRVERLIRSHPWLSRAAVVLSLGPIAGPLALVAIKQARRGEPLLAILWAIVIPLAWIDIACLTAALAHYFHIT